MKGGVIMTAHTLKGCDSDSKHDTMKAGVIAIAHTTKGSVIVTAHTMKGVR